MKRKVKGRACGARSSQSYLWILFVPFFFLSFAQWVNAAPLLGKVPQKIEDRFLPDGDRVNVEVWVDGLQIPWSLVFLPDGRALVSERPGRIRLIKEGKVQRKPYAEMSVAHEGEGGLMGLAIHLSFPEKPFLYAMYTYRKEGSLYNRVARLRDVGSHGLFDRAIIDDIPGGRSHDGGRIAFGPDGLLYVATGELFKAELAQDLNSLCGKILRITDEGQIPGDNPFKGSPVYSYGHRNPQGLSWHPETKDLFAAEHGPSGEFLLSAHDEINVITRGGNYGWPRVVGAPGEKPYIDPLVTWEKTTPPSGITFYGGTLLSHLRNDLFVATLRSESLVRIKVKRDGPEYVVTEIERWFAKDYQSGKYGRLRDVVVGPDGVLYFLTNNRDGRGRPREGDDKIYRVTPK